jgi:hypothetical protein
MTTLENLNEVLLTLVFYHMVLFIELLEEESTTEVVGFSLELTVIALIVVNTAVMLFNTGKVVRRKIELK